MYIYIYYNIYMCEHIPKKCSVMELGIFPKHGSDFLGSHCVWIPKVGRLKQFRVMLVIASFLGWVKTHDTLWLCQNSYWKWPLIVDFPIENGDFP